MCASMVDIQSATAEIRRGKKDRRKKKKPEGKNIMSASATQGGHNNLGNYGYKPSARSVDEKYLVTQRFTLEKISKPKKYANYMCCEIAGG